MNASQKKRLAILDMYDGFPNQGMRCIKAIVDSFSESIDWELFDVRGKAEVPELDFDIYISTGGPGNPLDGDGVWDVKYYNWLQSVWEWNLKSHSKKYVLFICHSFQMAVNHFKLARITPRRTMSFGTFPVFRTNEGRLEPLFNELPAPIWVADFRRFQVIDPDYDRIEKMGASILAIEKERPHVALQRALMSIRFSPEMMGVQFHPEADAAGMIKHFNRPEIKEEVINEHGQQKWKRILRDLKDPKKIARTHQFFIPDFIRRALRSSGLAATG